MAKDDFSIIEDEGKKQDDFSVIDDFSIIENEKKNSAPSVTKPPVSTSESVSGGLGGISPSMDNLRPTPKHENDRVKGDVISKSTISLFQNNPSFKIEEPVIEKENLAPIPTINDINNPDYAKQAEDRAAIEARKNAINAKNEKALANRERYFQQLEKKGISKEGVNAIKEDLAKNEVSNALYKQAGQLVQNNPDNKQATFELAVAAQNTGRYGDALNLFTKVLSMKGDSGQSGFVQSGGLESRTELPSSDNPANSLVGLGNVMYHTGDYKGALDYYKQALEADPTNYLAKSGVNLIEAKNGGKGIPFLSPQQVQDKIDAEKRNLEAPAKQLEADKKSDIEQNKRSQYIGDIAKSIEALAGVSEDEKGKVIGWLLNPIASAGAAANRAAQGMAKKGIEEVGGAVDEALHYDYSPKDISKTYGKKGEILDTEQEGQGQGFLHIPVKALAGAAHLAFAASPEFAKFMGATEGIKTIASQNENTKWVGDAVDMPFEVATKALNAIGIKPEEGSIGSYLEEAANLVIGGAILHSGGKAKGLIKDFASFKEASQLAAEDKLTPIQKLEYNNYLKLLNTVSLDDIAMVAKKSKTPESKVILDKIDEVNNFDAEKTRGEVENLKKDIESETDSDIKAQLQEKLSGLEQQLVSHTEKQAETIAHSVSNEIQGEELQAQIVDLEKKKEEANSETAKAAIQERIDEIKLQLPNILDKVESTPPVKVEGVGEGAEVGINYEAEPESGSVGVGGDVVKPTFENVPILTRTAEEIETAKNEVFNNLNRLEVGSVIENSDGEIKVVTEKSTDKKGNQLIGIVTYERQSDGSLRQMTNIVWASKSADGKIKLDYNPHSTGTNLKGERVTVTDQITDKKIDLSKENIFTEDENGNLIQINKVEQSLKETPKAETPEGGQVSGQEGGQGKVIEPPIKVGEGGDSDLHSAKNDEIAARRKAMGLDPIIQQIKSTDKELVERASDIYASGKVKSLVDNAIINNRYTLDDAQQIAISYERDNISKEYNELSDQILNARESGDIDKMRTLEADRIIKQGELDKYDQVLRNIGSVSAKVLRARRLFVNRQFDRAVIIRNVKSNSKSGEVPQELIDQIDKLTKERDDLSKELEKHTTAYEEETNKLRKQLEKAQVQSHSGSRGKKVETAGERAKVWADRVRKLKSKPFVFVDENGVAHDLTANGITWNELVEKTAKAIEDVGTSIDKAVELSSRIADIVKEHPLYKKLSEKDRERLEKQLEDEARKLNKIEPFDSLAEQVGLDAEGELHEGLLSDIDKMFKIKVEEELNSGKKVEDIEYNDITQSIFDALSEHIEGLDITELRDLISGYGKFKELSKDETVRAIAELKNQMRLDAKVEATNRGELPLRNGLERAKQSQKTREKNAEILKNIKEKGIEPTLTEEDKAAAYATATESHHRRIENAIDDIQKEIDENKRRQKSEPRKYTDERSKELESDLAKLKEIRDAKFKKPVKTAEEKKLENLQEKLDALLRNEVPETKDKKADSKEAKDLKEQIAKQKELLGLFPSKSTPADVAINATKKAIKGIEEQIDNLKQGKLEDGTPIAVGNKDGNKFFRIGGEKATKIDSQRLRELQSLKEGLQSEVNDLLPQNVKDLAVLEKANKIKQRRLDFLNSKMAKGKYDPTVFDVKKRQPYQVLSKDGKIITTQKLIDETDTKIKKAEKELDRVQEEWRLSQRSQLEIFGDFMNNIAREGAISNPTAIPKIFTSGALTQLVRPIENLIGVPSSYMLPESVRNAATVEGKFSLKTELNAQKQWANSDNWKQAWEKMKTGKHREDVKYGDKNYPEQLVKIKWNGKTYKINPYISGRMHAFAKTVPYRIGYMRNREYAYQDAILKHPEYFDSNRELTQQAQSIIETQAYMHALGDAFLQNNKLSQFVRNKISELQRSNEKSDKVKAFALNNIFKVLNVSANYFSAGLDYIPLVGNTRAQFAARSKAIEMTPERANKILRQNKRGTMGLFLFALGYAMPSVFGGYGSYKDENEEGVATGEVKLGDYELPHWLTHTPFLVPFQLGATMGNYSRSDDKDAQKSLMEATKGVIETNPFAYTFQTFQRALDSEKGMNQFVFDEAFGQWIPYSAAVRKASDWNDMEDGDIIKRVPDDNKFVNGFVDRMKIATGINRKDVRRKEEKLHKRKYK